MTKNQAIETLEAIIECLKNPKVKEHGDCVDNLRDVLEVMEFDGFNPAIMIKND